MTNNFDNLLLNQFKTSFIGYFQGNPIKCLNLIKILNDIRKFQKNLFSNLTDNKIFEEYNEQTVEDFCDFFKNFAWVLNRKNRRKLEKEFIVLKQLIDDFKFSEERKIDFIKNKICYCLHHSLPYQSDGYATRSKYMAEALSNCFETVVVTQPGFPWNNKKYKKNKNLQLKETQNNITYVRQRKPKKRHSILKRYLEEIKCWENTFIAEKPEYIIAASNYGNALPALMAAKRLGIPFYYEVRGFWEITRVSMDPDFSTNISYLFERFFETKVCQLADGVFTLTTAMKEELGIRGVDTNKITLTPNCANINIFNPEPKNIDLMKKLGIAEDEIVIGYIGTIQMYEGLDDLIKACNLLKNKNLKYKLLIVGGTSATDKNGYDKYLKNLVDELEMSDKVILTGRIPVEEVSKYYSLMEITPFGRKNLPVCDIVSPIKPLEAMAMKKTVIVSDLRALTEIVKNNETGMHFERGNIHSYSETLERCITDFELRKRLGESASEWIKTNRQWKDYALLIKKFITNK